MIFYAILFARIHLFYVTFGKSFSFIMKIFDKIQYTYILISLFVVVFFLAFTEKKAETSTKIRINRIGYPYAENTAVITGKNTQGEFYIRDKITNKVVTKGILSKPRKSLFTEKYRERPRGHPDECIFNSLSGNFG